MFHGPSDRLISLGPVNELKPQCGIKGLPGNVTIDRGALPQVGRDRANGVPFLCSE
jgi:hypothetical protein